MLKKIKKISKQLKKSSTVHKKQGALLEKHVKSMKKTSGKK
jgi:hypothetical protein